MSEPTLDNWKATVEATLTGQANEIAKLRKRADSNRDVVDRLLEDAAALDSADARGDDFPLEQQRDDWRARAERLLRERDEALREKALNDATYQDWGSERDALQQQLEEAQTIGLAAIDQRDAAREALSKIAHNTCGTYQELYREAVKIALRALASDAGGDS